MSSDNSVITVLAVAGKTADFRVRTTGNGHINDSSATRSFALMLLADARCRAREEGFPSPRRATPLQKEITGWMDDWYVSEEFMRESVGLYIEKTEVLSRHNVHDENDAAIREKLDELNRTERHGDLPPVAREDRMCTLWHHLVLRITVTEPRWLEAIEPGLVFGSTAYDTWWDDPLRPEW